MFCICYLNYLNLYYLYKCRPNVIHVRIPPPGCVWAQRPKHIILAVCLTDVKDPVIKVEKNKLYFKGVGGTEMKEHEVEMEFFKDIDVEVNTSWQLKELLQKLVVKEEKIKRFYLFIYLIDIFKIYFQMNYNG